MNYTLETIAKMIDHSLLTPTMTDADLESGCQVAVTYGVASVCIKPYYLARAAQLLEGSGVKPGATIGFPHGGHTTAIKLLEATVALADCALELDMVVNIGKVLSGDWGYVQEDIATVVEAGHSGGALVKVIFENCYLQDTHKIKLCQICGEVGADFVKTSTGYGTSGALDADLVLMRKYAPPQVQVKAAGGVRTFDRLLEVRALGVTRVGATATVAILEECKKRLAGG